MQCTAMPLRTANTALLTCWDACYAHSSLVISEVTGPKFAKYLHRVAESWPLNTYIVVAIFEFVCGTPAHRMNVVYLSFYRATLC